MYKFWSALFGVVMIGAVGLFVAAPIVGWWLPKNVSSYGGQVDGLFYLILAITGFFFILTEALLVYFMYAYASRPGRTENVFGHHYAEKKVFWTSFFKSIFRPVTAVLHNQHRVEMAWTFVPAVILLFIALVQINVWADIKYQSRMPSFTDKDQPLQFEVTARQFEWRVRYPSLQRMNSWKTNPRAALAFAGEPQADDIHVVNEIHTWKDQPVLVQLKTRDVIHSFYLPNLRLKQDALPGKTIPVWFKVLESNTKRVGDHWQDADGRDPQTGIPADRTKAWDLACAELCGWGHYKMLGRLYVHPDRADYEAWLQEAQRQQDRHTP